MGFNENINFMLRLGIDAPKVGAMIHQEQQTNLMPCSIRQSHNLERTPDDFPTTS